MPLNMVFISTALFSFPSVNQHSRDDVTLSNFDRNIPSAKL